MPDVHPRRRRRFQTLHPFPRCCPRQTLSPHPSSVPYLTFLPARPGVSRPPPPRKQIEPVSTRTRTGMGQTTSRGKTPKASNPPSSAGPSTQPPAASTPSLDEPAVASSERPKRSRRSSIRRSIIGLVGKPKGSSGTTHNSTARPDATPSSRKSWRRISRALSLGATEDGRTALATVAPKKGKGKQRATEEVEGDDSEQPTPSTSSQRQESPVPMHRQNSPSVLSNPLKPEDSLPEPSTEHDVGGPAPPLGPIDPSPTTAPASASAHPSQDPTPPTHPPLALDQPQHGPRNFPPPGTLVVVQGVVNTIDTGSMNNNNPQTSNTVFPTTPSRPNSGLFSGSARSRSSTPTGEHSGSRNSRRLSSIIRRPTSMFNDSRRNTIIEGEGPADASSLGHTVDSTIGTSSDAPSDSTTPITSSDSDPDNHLIQQRPLSPGSIDVLGTLLRYIVIIFLNKLLVHYNHIASPLPPPQLHYSPRLHSQDAQNQHLNRTFLVPHRQLRQLALELMDMDRWTLLRS